MESLQLYWLRHGIAEDTRPGKSDADRRLTPEGVQEVKFVAACLKDLNAEWDFILCSPLVRARETAGIAAKVLGVENKVEVIEGLLPEDSWEILRVSLKPYLPFQKILLVGHQPSFGEMIGHLVCPGGNAEIPLKKAGLCRLDVNALTANPYAELVWLLNPKTLRRL